jgi:hypothetical protein
MISPQRRSEILNALRRGAVPSAGLDVLAVGLERFEDAIDEDLEYVASGHGVFKAVRGEYGTGKTFLSRWLQERARRQGFATSEVQVSESETRLHKWQSVYRSAAERIQTQNTQPGALGDIINRWFFQLEEDVRNDPEKDPADPEALEDAVDELMERRLAEMTRTTPQFASVLRAYRHAMREDDVPTAQGLVAWLAGQPHVGQSVKREADLKGEHDHNSALNLTRGLLMLLQDAGHRGLVLVLDEVETLQRVRSDVREKSLNALRQIIDYLDEGRFPGLYVLITGTPAFFDGPQGIQRLPPLAQRLQTDFSAEPRFDNPKAPQIRLQGLGREQLVDLGTTIRDLFLEGASAPERVEERADDAYVADLADAVAGEFGGDVKIAPRLFLKKLVSGVLDRIDQHPDFDPREHYELTVTDDEMTVEERNRAYDSVDDIDLDVD